MSYESELFSIIVKRFIVGSQIQPESLNIPKLSIKNCVRTHIGGAFNFFIPKTNKTVHN